MVEEKKNPHPEASEVPAPLTPMHRFGNIFSSIRQHLDPVSRWFVSQSQNSTLTASLFIKGLGLVYLIAFISYWVQLNGLIGDDGILPASHFFNRVHDRLGADAYWRLPSIYWLWPTQQFLHMICALGCAASLALIFNLRSSRVSCILVWSLYLSLIHPGQAFYRFQWDLLLVETGFLAIFLSPGVFQHRREPHFTPSPFALFLARLLLFRLIFSSGIGKWLRGGSTWQDGHALNYHFWTQPLPNEIAYQLHQMPESLLHFSTYATLILQIIVPFLFFGPRLARLIAFLLMLGLQVLIGLSGNFAFFNLLSIVIALLLLDDTAIRKVVAAKLKPPSTASLFPLGWPGWLQRVSRGLSFGLLSILLVLHLLQIAHTVRFEQVRLSLFEAMEDKLRPFYLTNRYGLFVRMTTQRREITIEGSHDGEIWEPYGFRFKPSALDHGLGFVAPYQPRLDWQMWFAALGSVRQNPWLPRLMRRLQDESQPVLGLLEENPFPGKAPKFIRAVSHEYQFTTREERESSGHIWTKKNAKTYAPVMQ
jgi:lipase maturation factor 1